MSRRVRYDEAFRDDLAAQVRWLATHRPPTQREALRLALDQFVRRIATKPAIGAEIERRGNRSYRVFPIGGGLPYLVWYVCDVGRAATPVSLLMLLHEMQDRERFDAGDWD